MEAITELLSQLPEEAKDIRINVKRVLAAEESLDADQTWGSALACAYFIRNAEITEAILADAKTTGISDDILADAKAAAILMGQNTIYYRFRHLMNDENYNQRPANLRMMRMQKVASTKFELQVNEDNLVLNDDLGDLVDGIHRRLKRKKNDGFTLGRIYAGRSTDCTGCVRNYGVNAGKNSDAER